jgi:hypothetical protein
MAMAGHNAEDASMALARCLIALVGEAHRQSR